MQKQHGFSMIELIVSITILLILTGIGVPTMSQFVQNNKISATATSFLSMVNLARAEAIRRNTQVTLCGLNASNTCISTATGNDTRFETYGWAVFEDVSSGTSTLLGATAPPTHLIRIESAPPSNIYVRSTFAYATFTPRGQVRMNGSELGGSAKVCKASVSGSQCDASLNVRCIVISLAGSPSIMVPTGTGLGTPAAIAGAGTEGANAGCV